MTVMENERVPANHNRDSHKGSPEPQPNSKASTIRPVGPVEMALWRVQRAHLDLEYAIDQLEDAVRENGGD